MITLGPLHFVSGFFALVMAVFSAVDRPITDLRWDLVFISFVVLFGVTQFTDNVTDTFDSKPMKTAALVVVHNIHFLVWGGVATYLIGWYLVPFLDGYFSSLSLDFPVWVYLILGVVLASIPFAIRSSRNNRMVQAR